MAFPDDELDVMMEAAPGADLTADPATWTWVDVSERLRGKVSIHRGREDTYGVVGPATCSFRLANGDFRFTPYHPMGAHFPSWRRGTPVRVSLNPGSGLARRFTGEIDECKPVWPSGDSDETAEVQVTAKGILHRLGQGQVLDSPLRRAVSRDRVVPVAYWPMEDGSDATTFGSAVAGPPIYFGDFRPAADSTIAGSAPLPLAGPSASWLGAVPAYPAATMWVVRWSMRLPAAPSVSTGLMAWTTEGTIKRWVLVLVPQAGADGIALTGYDAAGTEVLADTGLPFVDATGTELYGQQLYFEATGSQIGADIAWQYKVGWSAGSTSKGGTKTGVTIGNLATVNHSAYPGLTAGGYTIGHVSVATDLSFGTPSLRVAAGGWTGERADARFARLCGEERLAPRVNGLIYTPSTTAMQLGPQQRARVLDLLRQVEAAEGGLLVERTDGLIDFRRRAIRYNRTPTLALDCNRGHVKLPFQPIDDDVWLRNDVTVSRINGNSARYPDVDVRDGTHATSLSLNLANDSDVPYRAQWEVHLGTPTEMRIPSLPINLQSNPDLIAQWLATDIGDWLTVDHLPRQYPPGQAGLVLEGYTETFDAVEWSATLSVSPSRPWEAWTVEHDRLGRLDTAGSQLAFAASETATRLYVTTTSGPVWITTSSRPQDFPPTRVFAVDISGMQIPVTAITNHLNANPYFETDTSDWLAQGTGCTIARSTTRAHEGAASLLITPPGGVATVGGVTVARYPVTVGVSYTASAWVYCPTAWADVRTCIDWYDAAGVFISTGLGVATSVPAATWTALSQSLTAPANAAGAVLRVRLGSTPGATITCYADEIQLTAANTQAVTVTRSAAGVDKALPAGAAVSLWRPGAVAH